jgi:LPS-assembly protein
LQSDYTGLFRDRTYSGLDRIASANQVTPASPRAYDAAAVERFNISVGQIYYFTESRTGDDNINWENNDTTGSLVWAGDTYWRMPMTGVYAGGSSTIRVWITSPPVTAPLNTVAMKTA